MKVTIDLDGDSVLITHWDEYENMRSRCTTKLNDRLLKLIEAFVNTVEDSACDPE